ncbi:MAG: methionyl-tRNA formyltransferase [Candidatus Manganitrophus sp. SA1]|nr:methionyl-tRNA formyltransferase [Candidatus Manganitrophus morganii]
MPAPNPKRLRAVFMGTPDFALPTFEALAESEEIIAVVTQPDRPKGRGEILTPPPIKIAALKRSIPVLQPERIRKDPAFIQHLSQLAPDVIIVVAFGQILPESVLKIPRFGCINVHASLLPKYRGAAPIQWAIIRGERETGVTTMQMDPGMDTGPILLRRSVPIEPDDTAATLSPRLAKIGASVLIETLSILKEGKLSPITQDHSQATLAPLLKKEDGLIRWEENAEAISHRARGVDPWPGMTTFYQGKRWKITKLQIGSREGEWGQPGEIIRLSEKGLEVAAGMGYILINELQPEGGRRMTAQEYAAGHPIQERTVLHQ